MTSGGQKPALGFTHRRDALLLLMTLQQCTSRTKPRFFKTFVCPKPQSAATILGFCVEKRTKTSLELARHNKPRFTKGTPRVWGDSLQAVGRFAPVGGAIRSTLSSRQSPLLHVFLIESLRLWASGRCLSADRAGVYSRSESGQRRSGQAGGAGRVIRPCKRREAASRRIALSNSAERASREVNRSFVAP